MKIDVRRAAYALSVWMPAKADAMGYPALLFHVSGDAFVFALPAQLSDGPNRLRSV
jgi:hypothetical protein